MDETRPSARDERVVHRPPESEGRAPGRARLAGRRILVVGAGQMEYGLDDPPIGNGRAISLLCGREGAHLACADREMPSVEETVRRVIDDGGEALSIVADVTQPDAVAEMVAQAHSRLGGLDGVVYNVGIGAEHGLEHALRLWDTVMNVNVRGAMLTARAALPLLDDGSSMVFISSVAGMRPGSRIPVYDTSKAALGGLVRHVGLEGERRAIRANIVAPGLMDTALGRFASQGRPSRARTSVPLGRQGTGWETAYAVLFLLSDESSYITGQTMVVDGGLTALR